MTDIDLEIDIYFNMKPKKATKLICRKEASICKNCTWNKDDYCFLLMQEGMKFCNKFEKDDR